MTVKMIPLDPIAHKNLHVKVDHSYGHMCEQNMVPLSASEFLQSSTNFPIVFVKQQETGKFKSVALLGFNSGENIVFNNGKVHSNYIPAAVRRYPFAVGAENSDAENMILCVDENSSLLNTKEGTKLFDAEGKTTEATQQISKFLTDILAKDKASDNFVEFLVEHDLLHSSEVSLKLGGEGNLKINGIYKVNEEALNELTDDVVLVLYKRKYFAAIYSHLASLSQFNRLLQLKAQFSPE